MDARRRASRADQGGRRRHSACGSLVARWGSDGLQFESHGRSEHVRAGCRRQRPGRMRCTEPAAPGSRLLVCAKRSSAPPCRGPGAIVVLSVETGRVTPPINGAAREIQARFSPEKSDLRPRATPYRLSGYIRTAFPPPSTSRNPQKGSCVNLAGQRPLLLPSTARRARPWLSLLADRDIAGVRARAPGRAAKGSWKLRAFLPQGKSVYPLENRGSARCGSGADARSGRPAW